MPHWHFGRQTNFPEVGHYTQENCDIEEWAVNEWKRGPMSALSTSAAQRQQYIKGQNYIFHTDTRYFGGCCQAEHIKAICPGCCVGCVLTAKWTAPGFEWDQGETTSCRRSRLGCFVPHQSEIVVFICVQMHRAKGEKTPLSQNVCNQSECESTLKEVRWHSAIVSPPKWNGSANL